MEDKGYLQSLGGALEPEIENARRALRLIAAETEKAQQDLSLIIASETEKAQQTFNLLVAAIQAQAQRQMESALEGLGPTLREWSTVLERASKIMGDNGWWIVLDLPIDFYRELVAVGDNNIDREELTKHIVRRANYRRCERLTKIVNAWDVDVFESRREHFAQALWAHSRKKYCVTVPTLLVHIEGIVREFVNDPRGWRFEKQLHKFSRRFDQSEDLERGLSALMNFYNLRTLSSLYSQHKPGIDDDPVDLNRNAVLHGLWTGYSTKEYSTKAFLLLDMLHSMLQP